MQRRNSNVYKESFSLTLLSALDSWIRPTHGKNTFEGYSKRENCVHLFLSRYRTPVCAACGAPKCKRKRLNRAIKTEAYATHSRTVFGKGKKEREISNFLYIALLSTHELRIHPFIFQKQNRNRLLQDRELSIQSTDHSFYALIKKIQVSYHPFTARSNLPFFLSKTRSKSFAKRPRAKHRIYRSFKVHTCIQG